MAANNQAQPQVRPKEKTSDESYAPKRPIPTDDGEFWFLDEADRDIARREGPSRA